MPAKALQLRRFATAMLAVMALVFLIAHWLVRHYPHPAWGYVQAFAEAAMVGGLADWFAVTALFRRPLGLPIPHTAIIPANKDRIAKTMAAFLRDNFLVPQVVARRLTGFNFAERLGSTLANPADEQSARLRAGATSLAADVLTALDPEQLGGLVRSGLKAQLERLDLAPLLGQLLSAAIADRRHLPVLESLLRWAGMTLEANEGLVRQIIHDRAHVLLRMTGLDEKVANAILDGLYRLLAEAASDADHPLRRKMAEGLEKLAGVLLYDPAMQSKVAAMKAEVLANPAMGQWLDGMWHRLRGTMLSALQQPDHALASGLRITMAELGQALHHNVRLQTLCNRFTRRTITGIANRYGDSIVRLVSDTVQGWDATMLTARIEGAVGRDLQFIRINGTLVGGLVGLVLHGLQGWL